jgi:hypothetical protein
VRDGVVVIPSELVIISLEPEVIVLEVWSGDGRVVVRRVLGRVVAGAEVSVSALVSSAVDLVSSAVDLVSSAVLVSSAASVEVS